MSKDVIPGADTARLKLLDLRKMAPSERNFRVFQVFEATRIEDDFCIVSDYDPKPLKEQFQLEMKGRFEWHELKSGPDTWEALIVKKGA